MNMATSEPPPGPPPVGARPPGLIKRYREELQARHYARRTVKTTERAEVTDVQCFRNGYRRSCETILKRLGVYTNGI
jgi:hypothetical protein